SESTAFARISTPRYGGTWSWMRSDARGSFVRCLTLMSPGKQLTSKPPLRQQCQTGERSTPPSRRYVASTDAIGGATKSASSSSGMSLRIGVQHLTRDAPSVAVDGLGAERRDADRDVLRAVGSRVADTLARPCEHRFAGGHRDLPVVRLDDDRSFEDESQ